MLEVLDVSDIVDEILEHHGIKGMKWGVQKAKETSSGVGKKIGAVKSGIHEHREKQAKKHDAIAQKAQGRIDEINANPSKWGFVQNHRDVQKYELAAYRDTHLKAAKDIRAGHLTDHEKHVIIGVGVTAGVLAAYGTYKAVDSGKARQLLTKNVPLQRNELLSRKMSHDAMMKEVIAPVNPNYGELGTKMNCRRATAATEMRRRGFDVKATKTISATGQSPTSILNAIDPHANIPTTKGGLLYRIAREATDQAKDPTNVGPVTTFMQSGGMGKTKVGDENFHLLTPAVKSKRVFDSLKTHPEGARGELGVKWSMGGAHSMYWEIMNGKPVIFDSQNATSFTQARFAKELAGDVHEAGHTRLDNLPLNQPFLRKWITNVK
jgi:hypothetical protein